jgi:hypothetical protein
MVPVKNADLWQRLDRLMAYHQVECRLRRIDSAHPTTAPKYQTLQTSTGARIHASMKAWSEKTWNRLPEEVRRRIAAFEETMRQFAFLSLKALRASRTRIAETFAL